MRKKECKKLRKNVSKWKKTEVRKNVSKGEKTEVSEEKDNIEGNITTVSLRALNPKN